MPVDFLSDAQKARYGRYPGAPSAAQLDRYFHLDDADRQIIFRRRDDHTRLGFALQLSTVRFLGTFLPDPTDVPSNVAAYVAAQLSIDLACLPRYLERPTTRREHMSEIQRHYDYRDFGQMPEYLQLLRWMYARCWLNEERPSILFDLTTAWLVDHKVLLPGVSVLTRLVARVRDRTAARVWRTLAGLLTGEQRDRLQTLLEVPPDLRQSPLDRLRNGPTVPNAVSIVEALARLEEIRSLGISRMNLSVVTPNRLQSLARYAAAARAQAIDRMNPDRKFATLLAFASSYEAVAQDDILDLLEVVVKDTFRRAGRTGQRKRLRSLRDLDTSALTLRDVAAMLLDPEIGDALVRDAIFASFPPELLDSAVLQVTDLTRPPDDHYYEQLRGYYNQFRRFLPALLTSVEFEATEAGQPVLDALTFLRSLEGRKLPRKGRQVLLDEAPRDIITSAWRRYAIHHRHIDLRNYTLCALDQLREGLLRRSVYVEPSYKWGDLRSRLLQGSAWEAVKPQVCRMLGRSLTPESELARLSSQLDQAYRLTASGLAHNTAVRIEQVDGRARLVLSPLDELAEPESLIRLRAAVLALMPRVQMPELLLEIDALTGFSQEFTHLSEGRARAEDLSLSVCAALLADAMNVGIEPFIRQGVPALRRGRLNWVRQNYLRLDTLTRANARLVEAQTHLLLAHLWGGGDVATADGLRFVVPMRTVAAGPNSRYFGPGNGVTYYNFASNQGTGFHGLVITGTLRDAPYLLQGIISQQTVLQPREVMTDTAGYSDIVFGLFWLLGRQFSPRLADIGDARFWRIDREADYGALNDLARQRINLDLITEHWDDFLRVAGSLILGTITAADLIRSLHRSGRASTLGRAIGELGRIAKTLFLLPYIDDEAYRRRILTHLSRHEGRHSLARAIFHGKRGELHQRYREGQEDQLGALGLVVNAVVLWNTIYMNAALDYLRSTGFEVRDEDVQRLAPFWFDHINFLGRYDFLLPEEVLHGQLRPLYNPQAPENLI